MKELEEMGIEELKGKLKKIKGSYDSFVIAVIVYAKKKECRLTTVNDYIDNHPSATTSDILSFISEQPDFEEDLSEQYMKVLSKVPHAEPRDDDI